MALVQAAKVRPVLNFWEMDNYVASHIESNIVDRHEEKMRNGREKQNSEPQIGLPTITQCSEIMAVSVGEIKV